MVLSISQRSQISRGRNRDVRPTNSPGYRVLAREQCRPSRYQAGQHPASKLRGRYETHHNRFWLCKSLVSRQTPNASSCGQPSIQRAVSTPWFPESRQTRETHLIILLNREMLAIRLGRNPNGFYTKSVDLWALGRLTAMLATYFCPFSDGSGDEEFSVELAQRAEIYTFEGRHEWLALGAPARDFIFRLLVRDGAGRMTATEALAHEWVKGSASDTKSISAYEQARSECSLQDDARIDDRGTGIQAQPSESTNESDSATTSRADTPAGPVENRVPCIKPTRSSEQWDNEVRQLQDPNWLMNPRAAPARSAQRRRSRSKVGSKPPGSFSPPNWLHMD